MTDQPTEDAPLLAGDALDALVASMTAEQFDELAQRTGHKTGPQAAADVLSRFARQENIAGGNAGIATAEAAFKRHAKRHGRR